MSKNTKTKKSQGNVVDGVKQFFVWHGEKFVVAVVAVFALYLAMQGMGGYQTLSWPPRDLEETAETARNAIVNNERTAEHEDLTIFDYAEHAEQIKKTIDGEFYSHPSVWNPPLEPPPVVSPQKTTNPSDDPDGPLPEKSDESEESEPAQDEVQ